MKRRIAGVIGLLLATSVAEAAWIGTTRSGGIAYFLLDSPPEVRRYDLRNGAWLEPLPLPASPTAFAVSEDALFVAFGRRISRFELDGTGERLFFETLSDAYELLAGGGFVYVVSRGEYHPLLQSVGSASGVLIDESAYWYLGQGLSFAPTTARLFGRTLGASPCEVGRVDLAPDGRILGEYDSPYHGAFRCGTRTFVFPGEAFVADDAGVVYSVSDLTYANSFGGTFDDLAFHGDVPIVLRGSTLASYSATLLVAATFELPRAAHRLFVEAGTIFAFCDDPGGPAVVMTPVSSLAPPAPGPPVDPRGLAYAPDDVVLGSEGVVYLLSPANESVFRWSPDLADYLPTIPLWGAATHMTYSAESRRLYLAYAGGAVHAVDLDSLRESPFANVPDTPLGLAAAGETVFVCDESGPWDTHDTFSPDGTRLSREDFNFASDEYVWSAPNRRMYFLRDRMAPNAVHWEALDDAGRIVDAGEWPYGGEMSAKHPLRVAPDASVVVLGSGQVHDATSLLHVGDLANEIADASWLQGDLVTARSLASHTEVQRWTGDFLLDGAFRVPGSPIRLFALGNELLVLTSLHGTPRFAVLPPHPFDLDGDAFPDEVDNCPSTPNPDAADLDRDDRGDVCDNCVATSNGDQTDFDGDGSGDACDTCVETSNEDQADRDGDRRGDACDNCIETANADQTDFDGDGSGDACETGRAILDADLSTRIDGVDLAMLGRHFGSPTSGAPYDARVDFDRDGDVDGVDLSLLAAQFGRLVF